MNHGNNEVQPAPPKPSRARTPYICYVKEKMGMRPSDVAATAYVSKLAAQWRLLTPEGKQPYLEMGEMAKREREVKMSQYLENYTPEEIRLGEQMHKKKTKRGVGKKQRDPNKPKRALTAFTLFFKEYSKQNKAVKSVDSTVPATRGSATMKAAGKMWRELSTDEQKMWMDRAAEAKAGASDVQNGFSAALETLPTGEDITGEEMDDEEDEYEDDEE